MDSRPGPGRLCLYFLWISCCCFFRYPASSGAALLAGTLPLRVLYCWICCSVSCMESSVPGAYCYSVSAWCWMELFNGGVGVLSLEELEVAGRESDKPKTLHTMWFSGNRVWCIQIAECGRRFMLGFRDVGPSVNQKKKRLDHGVLVLRSRQNDRRLAEHRRLHGPTSPGLCRGVVD